MQEQGRRIKPGEEVVTKSDNKPFLVTEVNSDGSLNGRAPIGPVQFWGYHPKDVRLSPGRSSRASAGGYTC